MINDDTSSNQRCDEVRGKLLSVDKVTLWQKSISAEKL